MKLDTARRFGSRPPTRRRRASCSRTLRRAKAPKRVLAAFDAERAG